MPPGRKPGEEEERDGASATPAAAPALTQVPAREPTPQERVLQMQRGAGNASVARWLTEAVEKAGKAFDTARKAVPAEDIAKGVYDALNGWDDEAQAIGYLTGHDADKRRAIKEAFKRGPAEMELEEYLIDQLDEDWLVKGLALLHSSNYHEPHAALALALIPSGVRKSEVLRLLEKAPLQGRREIGLKYDMCFHGAGEGGLKADLKEKLEDEDLAKALALLDHDLTVAEQIYLDSVAVTGTKTPKVIATIQETFKKGPAAMVKLVDDWNEYVRKPRGGEEALDERTFEDAMDSEMDGEDWDLVKACIDGMHEFQGRELGEKALKALDPKWERDKSEFTPEEHAKLVAAQGTLDAATTGDVWYEGAGTNKEQVFAAVDVFRNVYEARIKRARNAGMPSGRVLDLEDEWEKKRVELQSRVDDEMSTSGVDNLEAQLTLAGDLTYADRLYLAKRSGDTDRALSVVTKAWTEGKIDELRKQAPEKRPDGKRPGFSAITAVPIASLTWQRMAPLLYDSDDADRGARRIKFELEDGTSDTQIRAVYELLKDAPADLRAKTVAAYNAKAGIKPQSDETQERAFIAHVMERHKKSTSCFDVADLLDPTSAIKDRKQQANTIVERAEGRHAAVNTGLANWWLNLEVEEEDKETGADLISTSEESLERLRWMASRVGANEDELEPMARMLGATKPGELFETEYDLFKSRLAELREAKKAMADKIATAMTLLAEAILTFATAGLAAGPLIIAMGTAATGMLTKEALLGNEYELMSRANRDELVLAAVGSIASKIGGTYFTEIKGGEEAVKALGRSGAVMQAMAEQASKSVGQGLTREMFDDKAPTVDSVTDWVLHQGLAVGTAGLGKHVGYVAQGQVRTVVDHLRQHVGATVATTIPQTIGDASIDAARAGKFGDGTGLEWLQSVGGKTWDATTSGVVQSLIGYRGEQRAERLQAEADKREGDQRAAAGTPEPPKPPS